jgi:hypothetical protein
MRDEAVAINKDAQPYNAGPDPFNVGSKNQVLALLSALENADKHRELVVVAPALRFQHLYGIRRDGIVGEIAYEPTAFTHFVMNGAEIDLASTGLDPATVSVKIDGTVQVLIGQAGTAKTPERRRIAFPTFSTTR